MSFASDCKRELCRVENKKACCERAEHYGLLLFSRCFSALPGQTVSENGAVADKLVSAIKNGAGVAAQMRTLTRKGGGEAFAVQIPAEADRLRLLMAFGHGPNEPALRIRRENLRRPCCAAAFLRGAFLTGGGVTDPQKGYRVEFSTPHRALSEDFAALLASVGAAQFSPRVSRRGGNYVVYMKESGAVEDLLTYIGAVNAAMACMQIKMYKETYNRINRVSNFETANLDKTYSAASRQLAAIARIHDCGGLGQLPEDLRETAALRLNNPEMSLREMSERLSISRSGVNHRLQRILEFSETLEETEEKP